MRGEGRVIGPAPPRTPLAPRPCPTLCSSAAVSLVCRSPTNWRLAERPCESWIRVHSDKSRRGPERE